jgi:type I restriction enzyme, S subunit
MPNVQSLVANNLNIWTTAIQKKISAGRGTSKRVNLYGIKKLRELILDLAVRGQLTAQDPSDEPASELLEQIAAEKEKLVEEGEIKKQKPLPPIEKDEKPFELPQGWEWVRLIDLYYPISPSGKKIKNSQILETGEFPVVDQGQSYIAGFTNDADLLIEIPGPVIVFGDHTTARKYIDFHFVAGADGTKILRPYKMHEKYFHTCLLSYKVENRGYARHFKVLNSFLMAFPPLAEQHRITSKVDELMTLCDQLEQQTEYSITAHQTLVETFLAGLTESKDAQEFTQNWSRVAGHFDTLFSTEDSINQLKQTILQLAVMGKLVAQDSKDEPASVLLKNITAEKEQLIKKSKIKKQKALPEIREEEKPFNLPLGWEWVQFGVLAYFINGDRGKNYPHRNEYQVSGIPWINTGHIEPDGTLTTTKMNFITPDKFESLRSGKIQKGDLVYCLRGATFGKTAFIEPYEEGAIASSLMIIRPFITSLNGYIFRYLISPFGRSQVFRFDNGSAQPNLAANSVMLYSFPLPPQSEQHRIVAKLDKLMALCDQLKASLNDAQIIQTHLADAIVEQAVA